MTNLNDPYANRPRPDDEAPAYLTRQQGDDSEGGTMWGWIAGAAVLALVAAFVFGGSNSTSQMADQGSGAVPGVTRSTQVPSGGLTGPNATSPNTASPSATDTPTAPSTTGSGSSNIQ